MQLPAIEAVDARLAELLAEFAPGEVTSRQRAEDLVASLLTMYGGALRRIRELHDAQGAAAHVAKWTSREPLGDLLALHRADSPAPPPIEADDVRRAIDMVDHITEELETAPVPVRDRSLEMLAIVVDLHEAGLAQITGAIDDELRPPPDVLTTLGRDDLVASVLLIHGLHPEPIDIRLHRTLDELQRLSGPVASVQLVELTDDGARLRIRADNPSDGYRLRLNVERALAERVPDLASVTIDGGTEPVPSTSVFIPLESLGVRRSGATAGEVTT